jgi:hypothetical protein
MEPQSLSELSTIVLKQAAEVERLVEQVNENIRSANYYAGRAPSPRHYWVPGLDEKSKRGPSTNCSTRSSN